MQRAGKKRLGSDTREGECGVLRVSAMWHLSAGSGMLSISFAVALRDSAFASAGAGTAAAAAAAAAAVAVSAQWWGRPALLAPAD